MSLCGSLRLISTFDVRIGALILLEQICNKFSELH